MAPHVDLNVIAVGEDRFAPGKSQQLTDSLAIMTGIFAVHGPVIGTIRRFRIKSADAGALTTVRSLADAQALADRWGVANDALDFFVVAVMSDPKADGWSPVGGSCTKRRTKGLRAPVVSLNGTTANSGNTFAHELGHFLGLPHCEADTSLCTDPVNFIKASSNSNTSVTQAQAVRMRGHCQVRP
ncbi:M12 family metallo-peptidase [Amycolatopsis sp. NPDC021455]|uniref:M12 family metallo-peptidase n=1 Tax=Amycolatopsis sp. NPDC021455 TaxID=3154901 RepID=UPI0033F53D6A